MLPPVLSSPASPLPSPAPSSRLLARWTQLTLSAPSRWGRQGCLLIVLGLVAVVGVADYFAGFWVSLQLFYLFPMILAVLWLGRPACWLIAALCVTVRLLGDIGAGIFDHVAPLSVFWNRLAELGLYGVIVWTLETLASLHRELEERVRQRTSALERANADREELQKQLFEIGRRERGAIGHDLHDGLGQHLTATSMAATLLSTRLAASGHPNTDDARKIIQLLQEGIAKTRQIARGLLLSAVAPGDLLIELDELATNIRSEHGVRCAVRSDGSPTAQVTTATASHLFYIAQEAALNAARHAQASHIDIQLRVGAEHVVLTITDDGTGIGTDPLHDGGMGRKIMRHRADLIGGEYSEIAIEPHGTCIRCVVPLTSDRLAP